MRFTSMNPASAALRAATALALLALATPALADTLRGEAKVTQVTLYPEGASITRRMTISAPAGAHRLVIPGLPQGTDPAALRMTATGARIGAVSVQTGRALPPDLAEAPAVTEARAALTEAEAALRQHDTLVAAIRARAEAAMDTVGFLRDLAKADRGALPTDLSSLAAAVGAQMLAARQAALTAEAEAEAAAPAREPLARAVEAAQAALDAVNPPDTERTALVIDLDKTGTEPAVIDAVIDDGRAGWRPVYDARLDQNADKMQLDRGVLVRQDTGEDWQGVQLTLSTARPAEGAMPTELDSETVSLLPEGASESGDYPARSMAKAESVAEFAVDAAAVPSAPVMAESRMEGLTLVFDYPRPADIRSGVDGLRLALDSQTLTAKVRAEAVPRFDTRATLVAEATNGDQILLPGTASLYDGRTRVGTAEIATTAAGDRVTLGFGPIDGLTVERRIRDRTAGDRGIINRSNTDAETADIIVKNLTTRDWPLRVIDRVPVSEDEALRVTWKADPAPTETDPEGKRGILHWDQTLAAGATLNISLTADLAWPADRRLLR